MFVLSKAYFKKIWLKRLSISTFCIFVFSFSKSVYSEDLVSLMDRAFSQDAKYMSASHKLLADKEVIKQSRADLLPTLSVHYEHKLIDQTIEESDNDVFENSKDSYPEITYGASLTQSVFDYSRWQRYFQSRARVNKAEIEFDLAKQKLLLRLAESYFLVLERVDQLSTIQAEKNAVRKLLDAAERKFDSGIGSRTDMEDARARYLGALSKEVDLKSRLMDSRYALREIIGQPPGVLSRLRPNIALNEPDPADVDGWVKLALEKNLELQAMQFAVEVAEKEVKSVRGSHFPTVDLIASKRNSNQEGSLFGGGGVVDTSDVVLQLKVPLYSGGKASSKVRQAIATRESVKHDQIDKRRTVERQIHDTYFRVSTAIIQVEALQQSVDALQELLKVKKAGYRVGKTNLLETLDVEQDLSSAIQVLTKARYDYVLNALRLKFYVGDLSEADIHTVNGWLESGVDLSGVEQPI